jgi:outer membrane autotransporter protein
VTNTGSIETDGTKSDAIFAQSIGGGGGVGGATSFSGKLNEGGDSNSAKLTVGGSGTTGGAANTVSVTNTGTIVTNAVSSYGIDAQSVGGGGGKGATTASKNGALKDLAITVGGSGGSGGDANTVTVTHDGAITTNEREAFGILAQSVGGGGGTAHVLSSDLGTSSSNDDIQLNVTLGGSGGAGGKGNTVTVNLAQTASSSIVTNGVDAIGIVAQSIGGGGGALTTTSAVSDAQGGGGGIQQTTLVPLTIGDQGGSSGDGGAVNVTVGVNQQSSDPHIQTAKAAAYGILAQSVGGGGGLFVGATPSTELAKLYGGAKQVGDGGNVSVTLDNTTWMSTAGDGAVGIVAQSVGGGGGLIGTMQFVALTTIDATTGKPVSNLQANPTPQSGQGGDVTVTIGSDSSIVTTGANAHGIFAQAVGGGGGVVGGTKAAPGYAYAGTTADTNCGSNCTGNVNVSTASGSVVRVSGDGSYGVFAQSRANGSNNTTITVGAGSYIEYWNKAAGGIYVDGAGTNTVDVYGTIDDGTATNKGNANTTGYAVASSTPVTLTLHQGAVMNGNTALAAGSTFNNDSGATLSATSLDLGGAGSTLNNAGTIEIGGKQMANLKVNGNFVQGATGKLVVDVDGVARKADLLQVSGKAALAGQVVLRPTTLTPDPIAVMQGSSKTDITGLTVTDVGGGQLFSYTPAVSDSNMLTVTPTAKLSTAARSASFGGARVSLADHLQQGFVKGMSESQGTLYAQLATLPDAQSYRSALDNMSGETLQAAAVSAHAASLDFSERMNDCRVLDAKTVDLSERSCAWLRAIDTETHRSSSNDAAGYSGSTRTVQVGGQLDLGNGWFVGGSLGYDSSGTSAAETNGNVNGHGGSVGLIVKREAGPWLFAGSIDYGRGQYDEERHISVGTIQQDAKGSYALDHWGVHGRVAYRMPEDGWYLKPYVDLHAVQMRSGGFNETGADDLNLQVASHTGTILTLSPMVEVGALRQLDNGTTVHGFIAAGALLHNNEQWGAASSLQGTAQSGATPFTATAELPNAQGKVGVGFDVGFTPRASLRLEYGGEFGSGYTSQSVAAKLNVLF